jgi:hypothetical protein
MTLINSEKPKQVEEKPIKVFMNPVFVVKMSRAGYGKTEHIFQHLRT